MANKAAGTAVGPMVIAAVEQHRSRGQRLLDDPLAVRVLPPLSRWLAALARRPVVREALIKASERTAPGVWGGVACRKRYIDDQFTRALEDGVKSVVVLGAGLDTRAHRLAVPAGASVFEVDLPVNVERKRKRLPADERVVRVPIDFDTEDLRAVLTAHGYHSGDRCLVVWEGVTQYLTEDGVRRTFDFLAGEAPGSRLVFTYVRKDFLDGTELYGSEALHRRFVVGQRLWRFGLHPHEVGAFLAERGWREIEQLGPPEFDARYVRGTGRVVPISPLERTVLAEKSCAG
ncbi:SAM-dependent methyltransferase [Saccharothrix coeruleofusca]|uniref:S-adenosyl-L-methionine-dependent methyltransferase n=1 Tax=Saccharothrix coeruleofusca TaxID=33919 RepID=A0A918ART1_9PSEU|nr:SAM-dependent methyltransferase [Saccharothrix coeruleofusca]GGP74048.1 S-adenosyl-L-methionine-dependent methyltransferase [Saccharothrix coeruleofusca]